MGTSLFEDTNTIASRIIKGEAPLMPGFVLDVYGYNELPSWNYMHWDANPQLGELYFVEWKDYSLTSSAGDTGTIRVHVLGAQLFNMRPQVVAEVLDAMMSNAIVADIFLGDNDLGVAGSGETITNVFLNFAGKLDYGSANTLAGLPDLGAAINRFFNRHPFGLQV